MVIEMCGNDIGRHIIRRMLYRRKGVDLFSQRKYDNSSRMLSGASTDSRTSLYDTVNLTFSLSLSVFFVIILYIPKRCLIRQCTNRSGTKRLTCAEDDFRIFVCITLIISREVQVDIRFFISLKSKECLKRDVETVFCKLFSTHRTDPVWHIPSASSGKLSDFF